MIASKPCCESCTHYLQISDPTQLGNKEGECRRYPPQSVAIHVAANQIKILSPCIYCGLQFGVLREGQPPRPR